MTWDTAYPVVLAACAVATLLLFRWRLGFWPWDADKRLLDPCWRGEHEPGERDWVGRPMECARCGAIPHVDMSRADSERFYGRAAVADWNAEAMRRMAWDEFTAAMAGEWPAPREVGQRG